jgi:hypothetical protein
MFVRDIEFAYFYDFSIEFLEFFRQCDIFFFHFITGCEIRIMMMYQQQGLQKKYCKAKQYYFGAWGQAETSLKIVDFSWKYPKNNEQIKIKRQWLSPWGTSEIHGPFLGSTGSVPMDRMNPLSKALLCTTLDSVNPVLYPSIDTILCVLLSMPAASATAKMSFSVLRRLKTCVSSAMKNDRLSSLGLMHIHRDFER